MNERVTVRVPNGEKKQIETIIKRKYPELKTISAVVREALTDYLKKEISEVSHE